ncbi:uncharacterized protein LOC135133350 isoform X2 [Zophobas morio]|uniref:uncharacterized protein LOC135133350 isoform X2 n=1 Tax=Zophobas morio TaxID=2755281 RepID=UPI003083D144
MFKSLLPWKHTKTKVMVPEQTMEDEQILEEPKLIPCSTCGRTFLSQPLKKHAPVCEKNASKKRKVFDSLKQRVEGTDLAQFHQKSYLKRQDSTPKTAEKPKRASHWEENHRKLVDAIRCAKGVPRDMSPAKPKVQAASSTQLNERCPHCDRQFGPKAFDRHVEWCKEHQTRIQKSPANILLAKERLEARTKYKVPPLTKPKRTTIKEKYSNPTVSRTESVCSVKSTPTNAFRRNASVRKPKSVLDLGKKNNALNKADEKANSVVTLNEMKKNTEQSKSLRTKRFCPPREKVNLIHNENLESITVSPVKFLEPPAKKLVTWKEVSQRSPEKADDDSVIVVYENSSVFGKKGAAKKQSFIEEIKDLLSNSDDEATKTQCSSRDSLLSEESKLRISPKSKSSPEFEREKSPLELLPVAKSQPIGADDVKESESEVSFEWGSSEVSASGSGGELKHRPHGGGKAPLPSLESCHVLKFPKKSDIDTLSSSDSDFDGNDEVEESYAKDFVKRAPNHVSSVDEILSNFSSSLNKLKQSDDLIETELAAMEAGNSSLDEDNLNDKTSVDSVVKEADDSSNHTVEKYVESSGAPSLKSTSDQSFSSSKSLVNADDTQYPQSPKESARIPPQSLSDFGGEFTFRKKIFGNPFSANRSVENGKYFPTIEEYEVPKKRRKLNSTFIIDRPSLALRKSIGRSKNEKAAMECGDVGKRDDVDKSRTNFLPRILQESNKNVKVRENKKPSTCKLPALEIKQNKKINSGVFQSKWRGKEDRFIPVKKDLSDVFLTYQSFGSGDAAQKKVVKTTVGYDKRGKELKSKVNKPQLKPKTQVIEPHEPDQTIKPEDLFAVDDKMYAEYKIFEEMYLKEKEQMSNTRKQRSKNSIKSYGIEIVNEDYTNQNSNKVSGDSAYGRSSPKAKTTKLSPLQRQRIDSASSSGSENFVPPVQNNHRMSKFCHECGNKYPVTTAKFCPECGVKRLLL